MAVCGRNRCSLREILSIPNEAPALRYVDFYERLFRILHLAEDLREAVNRTTAAKLFGLAS